MPTTNFPYGITNAAASATFGAFIAADPSKIHAYFNDFDQFVAADWTVTETQVGATQALIDGDGGLLKLTNSAANNDLNAIQKIGNSFTFTAGKKLWFSARFQVSDATSSSVVVGLQVTDTTPLAVSDGVFFYKAAASTTLNLLVEASSTATTTAVTTMADATWCNVGFYYNGVDEVLIFADDVLVGRSVTTNLPTVALTISAAVANGAAAAKNLTIDYINVAKER